MLFVFIEIVVLGGGHRRATGVTTREAPGGSLRVITRMRLDFLSDNSLSD